MNKSSILPLLASAFLFVGCEDAKEDFSSSWNNLKDKVSEKTDNSQSNTQPAANQGPTPQPAKQNVAGNTPSQPSNSGTSSTVADAVSFGALQWTFGGFKGSGAKQSGVQISGLRMSKNGLSFNYVKNLSAWGFSNGQIDGVACLFVKKSNGSWVGGKFDWISSSRSSRDLNNVHSGYAGWSLSGVPNPCTCAFVILHKDGKKRSNVITGTWSR